MLISLTGILEDGSPRRPGVVEDPRKTVAMPLGTDLTMLVAVFSPSGAPVRLTDAGTQLLLTVKKRPQDEPPRFTKVADLSGNVGTFTIEPGDTRYLQPGQYVYDVWLTKDGSRNAVIPASTLQLAASVAAIPAAPPPPTLDLVENDTEPLVLDFSGTDITGWVVTAHIGYPTPLVKTATLTDPTHGIARVNWVPGDLIVGQWAMEIKVTRGFSTVTTDVFVLNVRAEI